MVSLITEGKTTDRRGRPFLRRRMRPWLALVVALTLVCTVVWVKALTTADDDFAAMTCNPPTLPSGPAAEPQPKLGKRVEPERLQEAEPAPLAETPVRVLNANSQSGQAANVAAQLSDLGFTSVPGNAYGNDSIYAKGDLGCTGQIRFGEGGRQAAATVQLAAPCAELIEDGRADDTVDLVLGSLFGEVSPNNDAEEVLRSLRNPVPGEDPSIDSDLLEAARSARC